MCLKQYLADQLRRVLGACDGGGVHRVHLDVQVLAQELAQKARLLYPPISEWRIESSSTDEGGDIVSSLAMPESGGEGMGGRGDVGEGGCGGGGQ